MKKKTLSILMILVFTMTLLFSNSLLVFASESTSLDKIVSLSSSGSIFEMDNDIDSANSSYNTELMYIRTSSPVYAVCVAVDYPDTTSAFKYSYMLYIFSADPFTYDRYSIYCNSDKISTLKENRRNNVTISDFTSASSTTYNNSIVYYTGISSSVCDFGFSNIPVYHITTDKAIYQLSLSFVFDILSGGSDYDYITGLPVTNIDRNFYLKNLGYSVRAEDSSENPDETYIKFTWDTDNLQEGDLLEIRTKNHYTKIGGDQVIGFHDYITASNGIGCFSGSYEISQTDAVKAWFATVESKPAVFKDYDTDIYFLRPVRGNVGGLWTKVTMGRTTPTSSPYIKDIEYGNLSDDGDWIVSDDITSSEGGNHGIDQNGNVVVSGPVSSDGTIVDINSIGDLLKYLLSQLGTLIGYFGQLPQLTNQVIGWLPSPIIVLICGFIAVVIILRIFGR